MDGMCSNISAKLWSIIDGDDDGREMFNNLFIRSQFCIYRRSIGCLWIQASRWQAGRETNSNNEWMSLHCTYVVMKCFGGLLGGGTKEWGAGKFL